MRRRQATLLVLAMAFGLTGCHGCNGGNGKGVRVNGSGSTFVQPVLLDWTFAFVKDTGHQLDYQGTGSGNGIQQFTARTIDFGCTDAPMNKEQTRKAVAAGGPVMHIPLLAGAVVPIFNIPGIESLTFSGESLAAIYLGDIRNWNDPKIVAENPGVALPDLAIQPVYRSDSSGSTAIFTEFLGKRSSTFRSRIKASTAPEWPRNVGVGQPKTDGILDYVRKNAGGLGYIEMTYALETKTPFGKITNRTGTPIAATLASITAAAEAATTIPPTTEPYSLHALTYSLTDAPGPTAYPISSLSYLVAFKTQSGPKGRAIVEFLKYATSEAGQALATERNYAPLPLALRKAVAETLATVEFLP